MQGTTQAQLFLLMCSALGAQAADKEMELRQKCLQPARQCVSRRQGYLSSFDTRWCISSLKPALE